MKKRFFLFGTSLFCATLTAQQNIVPSALLADSRLHSQSVNIQQHSIEAKLEDSTLPDEIRLSDKIQVIDEDNVFKDPMFYQWCNSIIKGHDGKFHLIYSRWKHEYGFCGWLTHSTIAHAVADHPCGPYKYVNTLINLDKTYHKAGDLITAHNPKIKYFDGKYYLYFISTKMERDISNEELTKTAQVGYSHTNWKPLRKNQRTYVASSSSLDGPFLIDKKPLIEPSGPICTITVNPAITQGHDGKYYLIVKGDKPGSKKFERNQAMAVSDYPNKGFVMQQKPVIQDWDTEDMSIWFNKKDNRYYAVFHAHTYIGMMTSKDGRNWEKASDFKVMDKKIQMKEGKTIFPERLERPFVFMDNDIPQCLSLAVKKGNESYIIFIPLKEK